MIFLPVPWRSLLILLLLFLGVVGHPMAAVQRVALVIGNAAYTDGPLKNPVNDARAMDQKLTALGFKVQRVENLKRQQIGRTLNAFSSAIRPGDEVVVFYAGHGVQVKGINYLPAVDADIQSEDDVPLNSLNLNALMDRLDDAKAGLKLLFLDACRNNPYARSFRSGDRGLARVGEAPSGTLIHFATRPGRVAADGTGNNGLYTSQLIRYIDEPNVSVETMLKRVSAAVEAQSRGSQEPWTEGSIKGEFFFKPGGGLQLASVRPEPVSVPSTPLPRANGNTDPTRLPVLVVASFEGERADLTDEIRGVIAANFERTGRFKVQRSATVMGVNARTDLAAWRGQGVQYLIVGNILTKGEDKLTLQVRFWSLESDKPDLGGMSYDVILKDRRPAAHRASDEGLKKFLGFTGDFSNRMAMVRQSSGKFSLIISESDGENPQSALSSPKMIGLPTWSDDQSLVAYVSFESASPSIFVHRLATGVRQARPDAQLTLAACHAEIQALQGVSDIHISRLTKDTWRKDSTSECGKSMASILLPS